MNGRHTDASLFRAVWMGIDLIMAHAMPVLDLNLKELCSGLWSCRCRLDSRRWWLTISSVGMECQEGEFFFSNFLITSPHVCIRTIRLPGEVNNRPAYGGDTGVMATLASVPWFIVGVTGIAYQWVASRVETYFFRSGRSGYRDIPIDEDAQILRFEDEEG